MSQTDSIGLSQDESLHIRPINSTQISQVHKKIFRANNQSPAPWTGADKCMNVLSLNRLNDTFYLADDSTNADAIVVSVLGDKRVGKSFLVDSLLSHEIGRVCRIMSKSNDKIVNSPALSGRGRANQSKIIYLDCSGGVTNQILLWNYFLSSVMIYNISATHSIKQESTLLEGLVFIQSRLDSDVDSLSLPQLIIVRRDCEEEYTSRDFVRQVENLGLFQHGIVTISLPYPGAAGVAVKQLLDVPLKQINTKYTKKIEQLHKILKSTKPKVLKGNYLTTKILSLTLQPVAHGINKEHKVCANKVWDQLIQNLSIGFYNYYLKQYQDQLAQEFQSQAPIDKYTLYKKLSNVRRKINKKVQGFKTLDDDPIFSKYKTKLNNTIKYKQNTLKQINQFKSKESNQKYCQKLFKQLDHNNCSKLVGEYCKSNLDDQKSQVLLQKFEKLYQDRSKFAKKKQGNNDNLVQKIQKIQKDIDTLEKKFKDKSNIVQKTYDYDGKEASIEEKTKIVKKLKQQLKSQQSKVNPQLLRVQEECQKLNQKIDNDTKELSVLRNQRDQQLKLTTKDLDARLKKQEMKLKQLQQQLKALKNKPKEPVKQKGTCCCQIF